jgi:hypothetical protein
VSCLDGDDDDEEEVVVVEEEEMTRNEMRGDMYIEYMSKCRSDPESLSGPDLRGMDVYT